MSSLRSITSEEGIRIATIEVDIGFFIVETIIALFALPFLIGWVFWKSYKNPEFWLRIRKQDYVYALVRNPLGRFLQIVVPLKRIAADGMFEMIGGKYLWKDKDEKGNSLLLTWKHGKPAAIFDHSESTPQAWVKGGSLHSTMTPRAIKDIVEMRILTLLMNADSMTKLMQFALILSVVGLLGLGALAFAFFNQANATSHLSCILAAGNNATIAAACK